jgi:hypothetical protein
MSYQTIIGNKKALQDSVLAELFPASVEMEMAA